MKWTKARPTSHYWRVRVDQTCEEQDFGTRSEASAWADKVRETLQVWSTEGPVTFTLIEVRERERDSL